MSVPIGLVARRARLPSLRMTGASIAILWLALSGCVREIEPAVLAGVDACRRCGMVIDQANQACGYIDEAAREFVTFDSPACLLGQLGERRRAGAPLPSGIFFADYGNGALRPAATTTFLLTRHLPTVMESGVVCFSSPEAAGRVRAHDDEVIADWLGFRTRRGEPDQVIELTIGPDGMAPERIQADMGELIVLSLRDSVPGRQLEVSVKGYPEVEAVRLVEGQTSVLRLLATRPGSGFPVVDTQTGQALGSLDVTGAHTADEAAEQEEGT